MNRNAQDAYANVKRNIEIVLNDKSLTIERKTAVLNAIDTAVYQTIDENCELPE